MVEVRDVLRTGRAWCPRPSFVRAPLRALVRAISRALAVDAGVGVIVAGRPCLLDYPAGSAGVVVMHICMTIFGAAFLSRTVPASRVSG
jgi:hypothetical protein